MKRGGKWSRFDREQLRETQREYDRVNKDRINEKRRGRRNPPYEADVQRKVRYGITPGQYVDLLWEQDGRCAACGEIPKKSKRVPLVVDHCHVTGRVRGLLCQACNLTAGHLEHPRRVAVERYLARG